MLDELDGWVKNLAAGDPLVVETLWREYFEKLVHLARTKLGSTSRRDQDEEDVALSAMHSFVRGAQRGRFPQLEDRTDLWRILLTITARKASRRRRRVFAAKRGGASTRGESVFISSDDAESSTGIGQVLGDEPTPQLAAEVAENCRLLIQQLQDPALEEIILLKLEGWTNVEIAHRLNCATRTVERKIERIREKWQEHSNT